MAKGFFEGILKDIMLAGAVEASRDKSGKPDPYKAAGIAMGLGHTSLEDQMRLATMLGVEGAFDRDVSTGEVFISPTSSEDPLSTAVLYDWRNTDLGSEYNILPEDFDSEEEFLAAIEEAESDALTGVHLSSDGEQPPIYSISIIPEDADLHEREIATRQYLCNKYSIAYPHVFTKDFLDQSFYDMGVRASKKANSAELPFIMLLDLVSQYNVNGLGVFYLLLDGKTKKSIEACKKYMPKIMAVIENSYFEDSDLEALLSFVQGVVVLEMHDLRTACDVLYSIRKRQPESVKDDILVSFCTETVEFLTDGTIKASFDSKIRYLNLCAKIVDELSTRKCHKNAIERTYAENEAQQLVYRFRPDDRKALLFWDVGDDFMEEFVFDLIMSKEKGTVCDVFRDLLVDQTLTNRQREWVLAGFDHLMKYAADGYGEDQVYDAFSADATFRRQVLGSKKNRGKVLGHLLAMAFGKHDLRLFLDIMNLYKRDIRNSESQKRDFCKHLNEQLECTYIDPFCDRAERFEEYKTMSIELKSVATEIHTKQFTEHICRLCADIDNDYNKFLNKMQQRNIVALEFQELTSQVSGLVKKIASEKMWRTNSCGKKTFRYVFKYPDGKNGDINMHLASRCGVVTQIDPITRQVEIRASDREILPLLIRLYDRTDEINSGIKSYLDEEHNIFSLFSLLSKIESVQSKAAREHGIELSLPENLWSQVQTIQSEYVRKISDQRDEVYQTLAKAGMLSAKWVSEYQVFTLASALYPDAIYQYRTPWLGSQSLDVYIPSINVGIEYQGVQHYRAVDIFGGEDALKERIKLDARKKRLCKQNGVTLVEVTYSEEIALTLIRDKINKALNETH